MMTPETLKRFAPCPRHRVWKDVEQDCLACLVELADAQPLPEDCRIGAKAALGDDATVNQ